MNLVRAKRRSLLGLVVVALFATACAPADDPVGRTLGSRAETSTSPELIKEASDFGGIVIPAGAVVLQASVDGAIDTRYRLALKMSSADLQTLLSGSHFNAALTRAHPPFDPIIAGPPLASSPSVLGAQDRYRNAEGKSRYRDVIVDEREPDTRFVHLSMFTT
ncbi:hypothetical protein BVU76_08115 [Mycolicibacterium porcinum]|nr:hypothetical protein BVU76_08115 [Mycolicibacterium porcinum]